MYPIGGWEGDKGRDLKKSSMKKSKTQQYLVVQQLPKNVCDNGTKQVYCNPKIGDN